MSLLPQQQKQGLAWSLSPLLFSDSPDPASQSALTCQQINHRDTDKSHVSDTPASHWRKMIPFNVGVITKLECIDDPRLEMKGKASTSNLCTQLDQSIQKEDVTVEDVRWEDFAEVVIQARSQCAWESTSSLLSLIQPLPVACPALALQLHCLYYAL